MVNDNIQKVRMFLFIKYHTIPFQIKLIKIQQIQYLTVTLNARNQLKPVKAIQALFSV